METITQTCKFNNGKSITVSIPTVFNQDGIAVCPAYYADQDGTLHFWDNKHVLVHIDSGIWLNELFGFPEKYNAIRIAKEAVKVLVWTAPWFVIKSQLLNDPMLEGKLINISLLSDDARRAGFSNDETYISIVITAWLGLFGTQAFTQQLNYRSTYLPGYLEMIEFPTIKEHYPELYRQLTHNYVVATQLAYYMQNIYNALTGDY